MSINQFLPNGASYEKRTERTKKNSVRYDGNKFERIDSADQMSRTVRLLHEGKLSTVGSSKPGSGEELIKQAAEMVQYGSPHDVEFVGKTDIAPMNLVDETTLSSKQMIDKIGAFVEDLRSFDSRLVVSAGLDATFVDVALETSHDFNHSYRKSLWSCGASIELMQGEDLLAIYKSAMSIRPDFDLAELKEQLARKLEYSKNVVSIDAGAYPVIFSPAEVGNVLNPIVASLSGQAVYRKISPWSDKLGQTLLDERVTLLDNGAEDGAWPSKPFDLEGTPTRRNVLVQNGTLGELITNRKVAAQLGRESSGNASPYGASPNYLQLAAGSKSFDDLVKSIDKGVLIDGTMGAWSGNPYSGIVSGTISMGLKIENGKIVGRIKDCMFTVNTFEHLRKHLIDCSAERDQLRYGGLFPHMLLNEVVISTK